MSRLPLRLATLALVCVVSAGAAAQDVYKWKDARGVTHYGDAPPAGVKATRSAVKAPTPRPVAAVAAPAESAQCTGARKNLTLLQGTAPVGIDSNGDGKPDSTMDAAQRASQAKLAQAGIEAYCTGAVAAPPRA